MSPSVAISASIDRITRGIDRLADLRASASDRAMVLDCLRVRDLGGDWLGHPSFDLVEDYGAVTSALVCDGLAMRDEFGTHITPAGRRAWADQRIALRDLTEAVECSL